MPADSSDQSVRRASIGDENRPQRGGDAAVERARERCEACDRPTATDEDWNDERIAEGERDDLCWGIGANCQNAEVDWRARSLSLASALAEAERQRDEAHAVLWARYGDYEDDPTDYSLAQMIDRALSCADEGWHHVTEAMVAKQRAEAALADTREALREIRRVARIALAAAPLKEGEPCPSSPSSSGETPEPAALIRPSGGSLPSAATPAPIRKDGATAGSGVPLGWRGVYPGMCIDPNICRGRSACPRDYSCSE